ncbi:CRISPR-associated helicase Cas3' [candidate division KSB1 bacterium]|nr:CRISPR-associated helicase Cas3' [candidate division KSB1 bacterium]
MNILSHCEKNTKGEFVYQKRLIDHLTNVTTNILKHLQTNNGFTIINSTDLDTVAHLLGNLHDHGKYLSYFQEYLIDKVEHTDKKNHAFISAITCFNLMKKSNIVQNDPRGIIKYFVYYCIRRHHGHLKNLLDDNFDSVNNKNNIGIQKQDLLSRKEIVNPEMWNQFEITEDLYNIPFDDLKDIPYWLQGRLKSIEHYFFVMYLFSLLIEADKLDASNTEDYTRKSINRKTVDNFLISINVKNKINNDREEVKQKILDSLKSIDLSEPSIMTLTAPTGIGKTLASLNFALYLKDKIRREQGIEPFIIYSLPFINIIEQTVSVFERVLEPEHVKVVKHHQYADVFNSENEIPIEKLIMQLETWQGDLVVTTFVQLLHTIIGNRNSLLKKFHRLANSIIILDEVQNIDVKYWPLIGGVLFYLTKFLKSHIIMMTATQPLIFETAQHHLLQNEHINIIPLLTDYERYFKKLDRTKLVPLLDQTLQDVDDFIDVFDQYWMPSKSCIIVVNTIARSQNIFNKLQGQYPETDVFYLSTNIIPKCRKILIYQIKKMLKQNKPIILVATQCVEAGVDLDFDMGFRDLGPLDSIIQVAGRINRNGLKTRHSPLYVFEFESDSTQIYGAILPNRCKRALLEIERSNIEEEIYLTLIHRYFNLITAQDGKSMQASIEIFDAMKKLRFTKLKNETEKSVSDFQLIEHKSGYTDVFVCINKTAERFLDHFKNRYLAEDDRSKRQLEYVKIKKNFNRHIISIPSKKAVELQNYRLFDDMYYIPRNKIEQYYDFDSGYIRDIDVNSLIF